MAAVILDENAQHDVVRLVEFLLAEDPAGAGEANEVISDALSMLARHPLIGRPAEEGLRELVISRGRSGYVALYEYPENVDLAVVLAVRHQRESGFSER